MTDPLNLTGFPTNYAQVSRIVSELREYRERDAIASRFPATYAYDYVRQNPEAFGLRPDVSRSEVGAAINAAFKRDLADPYYSDEHFDILLLLARAYCLEHRLRVTEGLVGDAEKRMLAPEGE